MNRQNKISTIIITASLAFGALVVVLLMEGADGQFYIKAPYSALTAVQVGVLSAVGVYALLAFFEGLYYLAKRLRR